MMNAETLPVIFVGLMGFSILVYALLDGYDLGVGMLLPLGAKDEASRDTMIASIGPFWDANETWLVLAVGLMLIAFPPAHSLILKQLYLPVTIMLVGLIMRGVAFDFRAKAALSHKGLWDMSFKLGSTLTSLSQGFMLGHYVVGFSNDAGSIGFAVLSALGVTAAYCYIGGAWLLMKTEHSLQRRAAIWARRAGQLCFVGVLLVSLVNPWVNPDVFARWFGEPQVYVLWFIPAASLLFFAINERLLQRLPLSDDRHCAKPFFMVAAIFTLCFSALALSFFPYIVPGKMTIWQAASAPESLRFILVGAVVVVPVILMYTAFSYYVFRGKATGLSYH